MAKIYQLVSVLLRVWCEMAEAGVEAAPDEAGTRSASAGSRRSQRDYRRRRQQRHCSTLTTASVGTTDDTYNENIGDHAATAAAEDEPNDRILRRRGAVRERRHRYVDVDGTVTVNFSCGHICVLYIEYLQLHLLVIISVLVLVPVCVCVFVLMLSFLCRITYSSLYLISFFVHYFMCRGT